MTETAKSKQIKYCQRLSVISANPVDDCNNINRNITLRQDKMLIISVTLTKIFKVTQVLN